MVYWFVIGVELSIVLIINFVNVMIHATVVTEGNEGIYDVLCSGRRPREIFLYFVWDFEFNNINFAKRFRPIQ